MPSYWRNVWITGGSSGIGRELALKLASSGSEVIISSRRQTALKEVANQHSNIHDLPLDVTDRQAVTGAVEDINRRFGQIDLGIFSAALWYPMDIDTFDIEQIDAAMQVNFIGCMNCISSLLPHLMRQSSGHLALISSVAGYKGLPRSLAYGPSKAALISFAESVRPDLEKYNIGLTVINPGFVDTEMTRRNDFPMPWIMTAEKACEIIINGLNKQKFEIAFPWQMVILLKLARILPYPLYFRFIRIFFTK